jgi:methylase of polypeptide subunit release factors
LPRHTPTSARASGSGAGALHPRLVPALRAAALQLAAACPEADATRALAALLFERCAAAQERPVAGAVLVAPEVRAVLEPLLAGLPVAWAGWTGRHLGAVYEALLDPAVRRRSGIYYTPAPIVESILAATLDPLLAEAARAPDPLAALQALRVLDPACGAGYFLVAAAERIAAALAAADPAGRPVAGWLGAAAGCVYGVDSDPAALDLARYSLYLAGAGSGTTLPTYQIHCGDALAALPAGWTGFDTVVGNPPYLPHRTQPPAHKAAHRGRYAAAQGQYDLSGLFIERGLELLRPGGRLGYIVPNKFMAADYGAALRALLAQETRILRLEDVSADGLFPGAATYPVILVAQAGPPPPGAQVTLAGPGRPATQVAQAALCGLDGGILPACATAPLLEFARHLAALPGRLPAAAIGCGIARTGFARAAISAAAYAALPPGEQATYRSLLQGQDIGAYALRPTPAPLYLPRNAMTAAQWAACEHPKVLVPGVVKQLRAAYTAGGPALGRVYYVKDGAVDYDPYYLLALLNSRVLAWYYRFLYWPVHLGGGYLRVNSPYLARLPLPAPAAPVGAALAAAARELTAHPERIPEMQPALDAAVCDLYEITMDELAEAEAALATLTTKRQAR